MHFENEARAFRTRKPLKTTEVRSPATGSGLIHKKGNERNFLKDFVLMLRICKQAKDQHQQIY